jgi:hypothetical protein
VVSNLPYSKWLWAVMCLTYSFFSEAAVSWIVSMICPEMERPVFLRGESRLARFGGRRPGGRAPMPGGWMPGGMPGGIPGGGMFAIGGG